MSRVFDEILIDGIRKGHVPEKTKEAREWYQNAAKHYGHTIRKGGKEAGRKDYARLNEKKIISAHPDRLVTEIKPGNLYMYLYDAKTKDTLPYWDQCPMVFPFHVEKDRFWGINIHYIDLRARAMLFDALTEIANNKKFDSTTKLKMSYQLLNSSAKFKWFKPCVKQYLISQLKTQFMYIHPSEWSIALFLPLERFVGASKTSVWAKTRKQING